MFISERIGNLLIGCSVISWAVLGMFNAEGSCLLSPVRLSISVLNLCVGVLFIFRSKVKRHGGLGLVLICLPALAVAGWALKSAPEPGDWPVHAQIVFVVGAAIAVTSFLFLWRNFAILPAVRDIVVKGPYAVVRHPAYAGELLMIGACCLSAPGIDTALPFVAALPMVMLRVTAEERVLASELEYERYSKKVRWRILPYVW